MHLRIYAMAQHHNRAIPKAEQRNLGKREKTIYVNTSPLHGMLNIVPINFASFGISCNLYLFANRLNIVTTHSMGMLLSQLG